MPAFLFGGTKIRIGICRHEILYYEFATTIALNAFEESEQWPLSR